MPAMTSPVRFADVSSARRRANDTAYLTERYHRSFEEELSLLVPQVMRQAPELAPPLDRLGQCLAEHRALLEGLVFPLFDQGGRDAVVMLQDRFSSDALALLRHTRELEAACARLKPCGLVRRISLLAQQVEEHMVAEAELLGGV